MFFCHHQLTVFLSCASDLRHRAAISPTRPSDPEASAPIPETSILTTMSLVLPGDDIPLPGSSSLTLGPGLRASSSRCVDPLDSAPADDASHSIVSSRLGLLSSAAQKGKGKANGNGERLWVEGNSRRVSPDYSQLHSGQRAANGRADTSSMSQRQRS